MTAPAPPCARRQVFVCGDLHNLGDLKLLLQNLALTGGRGGLVRRWTPLPPAVERQVAAAGGVLVPGRAIADFARRCWGADIVLGGGQLVRENVSQVALLGLLLAVIAARLGGGRLVTRGLGVSAIRSPRRRLLWRLVLSACRVVRLRDEASARNLAQLMPGKACQVHADMVFLPVAGAQATGAATGAATGGATGAAPGPAAAPDRKERRWIVVAPCVDGSEGRSIEGAALDAALEAALAARPGAEVIVACHDPREGMDKAVAARLLARWPDRAVAVLDGYELDALDALYHDAALVLTNRLHALIFAVIAEAPVVAIEDGSAKVRAVADRFAVPVLAREAAVAAAGCVARALDFDRALRRRERTRLARVAQGNL